MQSREHIDILSFAMRLDSVMKYIGCLVVSSRIAPGKPYLIEQADR